MKRLGKEDGISTYNTRRKRNQQSQERISLQKVGNQKREELQIFQYPNGFFGIGGSKHGITRHEYIGSSGN